MSENETGGTLAVTPDELDRIADDTSAAIHDTAPSAMTPDEVASITRAELLAFTSPVFEWVEIPEFRKPGHVGPCPGAWVRSLSATERDAFESSLIVGKGKNQRTDTRNIRAKLVALTVVASPKNPSRLFTQKDVDSIGRVHASVIDRIYSVASRVSGISERDVEELAGNSDSGLPDDS